MNKPYRKIYENGILTNPIKGAFVNNHPNRRTRRAELRAMTAKTITPNQGVVIAKIGTDPETRFPVYVKYKKSIQRIGKRFIQHMTAA